MSNLKGVRTVIFPARDIEASIVAWTNMLGNALILLSEARLFGKRPWFVSSVSTEKTK